MSKVFLCPHENVNWSGIPKAPDGIDDGLYVKYLACSLTFPPFRLDEKVNMLRNFTWDVPNCEEVLVFYSDLTSIRVGF